MLSKSGGSESESPAVARELSQLISLVSSTSRLRNWDNSRIQVAGAEDWGGLLFSEPGLCWFWRSHWREQPRLWTGHSHSNRVSGVHLKASMSLSTFWASPWTRIWAWNFRRASSSSVPEKSISSTTQLRDKDRTGIRNTSVRPPEPTPVSLSEVVILSCISFIYIFCYAVVIFSRAHHIAPAWMKCAIKPMLKSTILTSCVLK